MHTDRSILVNGAYQITVNLLGHERNHRSSSLCNRYERGVQSHVSIDLILLHALCPETFSATTYIPVTHLINELEQCTCGLRNTVVLKMIINFLHYCVQLGQQPLIHYRQLIVL